MRGAWVPTPGEPGPTTTRLRDFSPGTESVAAFAQATWSFSDQLSATLGVRDTRDDKTMRADNNDRVAGVLRNLVNTTVSKSWSSVTSRAVLKYQFTPDAMVYASYSEGFRSGGFNARVRNAGQLLSFDPETAHVYEVGAKAVLLQNRLRLNGAA